MTKHLAWVILTILVSVAWGCSPSKPPASEAKQAQPQDDNRGNDAGTPPTPQPRNAKTDQAANAQANPEILNDAEKKVEAAIKAYLTVLRSGKKPEVPWQKEYEPLLPLLLPRMLASENPDVLHEALVLARDLYGRRELVPNVIVTLDRLLKAPKEKQGPSREVACEFLAQWPDYRSVPTLLKALDDPYFVQYLVRAPGGTGDWEGSAVWVEADRALCNITGASPVPEATGDLLVYEVTAQRKARTAAWQKWWDDNKARLLPPEEPNK